MSSKPRYAMHAGIPNVVGHKVREMVPDEAEAWVALYRRVLETGDPPALSGSSSPPGAIWSWLLPGRARESSTSAVVFRDVTARKQPSWRRARASRLRALNADLERQVAERTRQLGRTWQVSPDLLGVANATGYFTSSNPAWEQTLGWTQEEIARTPFMELLHPDDIGPTLAAFDKLKHGEPVLRFENRYRGKDGTYRWISWVAVPEGEEFYCSGRNVTVEKEQAAELAERRAELDRLWTLSEDMLARADYRDDVGCQPGLDAVLGWTEAELLARPYATFMHPDDMTRRWLRWLA